MEPKWNLGNLGKKYPYVTGVSRSRVLPAASDSNFLIVKRMSGTISEYLRRFVAGSVEERCVRWCTRQFLFGSNEFP